jgi:hypothetical protein
MDPDAIPNTIKELVPIPCMGPLARPQANEANGLNLPPLVRPDLGAALPDYLDGMGLLMGCDCTCCDSPCCYHPDCGDDPCRGDPCCVNSPLKKSDFYAA